jgi:hypothetical protein
MVAGSFFSPTVSDEVVSVDDNIDKVSSDFLGEVYVFNIVEGDSMELSLNSGYRDAVVSLDLYYSNSSGLIREGFGGGSSSIVSNVNSTELVLNDNGEEIVSLDDDYVVALASVDVKNSSIYSEHKGNENLYIFLFSLGFLLFFAISVYAIELYEFENSK